MILRRNPNDRFSTVAKAWDGLAVVILGGGPSLTPEQFEMVRAAREADAVRVIAINDAFLLAPWADVCYAADAKWHAWMGQGIAKPKLGLDAAQVRERWASFAGQKCGLETAQPYLPDAVHMLRVATPNAGLSANPGALGTGRQDGYMGHSGFQALNLAVLAGAEMIILLGFDGRPVHGNTHFHGGHAIPTPDDVWFYIQRSFSSIENDLKAKRVRVFNCSQDSAINSFYKIPLEEAIWSAIRVAA